MEREYGPGVGGKVYGDTRQVRAGDIALCTDPGSFFSAAIRRVTGSEASHAALVTRADPTFGRFQILEVGWRLREASMQEFPRREWIILRPMIGLRPVTPFQGVQIAVNTVMYLKAAGALGQLYPWWKLPAYLLQGDWRGRLIVSGARQVCSVISCRAAVAVGVDLWRWDGDRRVPVRTADDVESISPADLIRSAVESGWEQIAWTANAPVI